MKIFSSICAATLLLAGVAHISFAQGNSKQCDRACLEGFVEQYLDAAIAHNPKLLPLAPDVKFTENGQRLVLPDAHWKIMTGKGKYRLFVTDADAGQVTCMATIREEGNTPEGTGAVMALRLKVKNRQITEIESMVVRPQMSMGPPCGKGKPGPIPKPLRCIRPTGAA
jgi:hypothetical protein